MSAAPRAVAVAAGLLQRADARWLLAQRPVGKADAGLWEFPGGKLKPGESADRALARELHEELGISIEGSEALAIVTPTYAQRGLRLHGRVIRHWRGDPVAHEHQALRWVETPELIRYPMPRPDWPLRARIALPPHYAITPEPESCANFAAELRATLARPELGMISLRMRRASAETLQRMAEVFLAVVRAERPELWALVHGDPAEAETLGFDGVHLRSAALRERKIRPPGARWVLASVHDAAELRAAEQLGVDAAVLAPVAATATHPGAHGLGWQRFARLARGRAMPTYALGGVRPDQLAEAQAHGAFGVAAIRGYWAARLK